VGYAKGEKPEPVCLSLYEKSQLLSAVAGSRLEVTQLTSKHLAETHRNALFGVLWFCFRESLRKTSICAASSLD
jgi:hypothetical protein